MAAFTPPGPCPVCSEDVPPRARACPDCGACRESGWNSEDAEPADDTFNYDEFVAREFGQGSTGRRQRPPLTLFWWGVALVVLLAMLYLTVGPLLHFR